MCSSCGGGRAAARIPGSSASNPIVLGEPNDEAAAPATFLEAFGTAKAGSYKYVTGDGVEAAVEEGKIRLGLGRVPLSTVREKKPVKPEAPEFYVRTGRNKWIGFTTKPAAERYAKATGGEVTTREGVLQVAK